MAGYVVSGRYPERGRGAGGGGGEREGGREGGKKEEGDVSSLKISKF